MQNLREKIRHDTIEKEKISSSSEVTFGKIEIIFKGIEGQTEKKQGL